VILAVVTIPIPSALVESYFTAFFSFNKYIKPVVVAAPVTLEEIRLKPSCGLRCATVCTVDAQACLWTDSDPGRPNLLTMLSFKTFPHEIHIESTTQLDAIPARIA
jgi:hypothetical protein